MRLFPKGLSNFTKEFLSGVWYGMGPDITRRTIKSPPKPRPTSLRDIKEAVKKAPPKRRSR